MRVLQVKAARGWSREQAAQRLLIDEQTVGSWSRQVDEEGEAGPSQGMTYRSTAKKWQTLPPRTKTCHTAWWKGRLRQTKEDHAQCVRKSAGKD
jgi:transposase